MPRRVFLENWQEQLESTIVTVEKKLGVCSSSLECDALFGELRQLKEMARQVQDVAPANREEIESYVIAISVREPLRLSAELLELFWRLFDIYRRFRTRLSWDEKHEPAEH